MTKHQPGLLLICLALCATPAHAATDADSNQQWLLCPTPTADLYQTPPDFPPDARDDTRISASQVENTSGDVTTFNGDVIIEQHRLRLHADQAVYNRDSQQLDLLGHIQLDRDGLSLKASDGQINLDDRSGYFNSTRFYLPDAHFFGQSPRISIAAEQQTSLLESRFSSCPGDDPDWHLDTDSLVLDQQQQLGTARNAVLWFKSVPLFYTPYISFPLGEQRRSGFLMPGFGTSNSRGFELSVPWYWNIAPNQDAVLTPTYMRKRGTLLGVDYRFLTHSSQGNMEIEYLNRDRELDMERYLIRYSQLTRWNNGQLDIIANDASDSNYLTDMSTNIAVSSVTHLERRATAHQYMGPFTVMLSAQAYETLDELISIDNRPYRRLPQLTLNGNDDFGNSDLFWSLDSEWVNFKHESDNRIQGDRFSAYPKLSWSLQGHAWFIKPAFGVHYTRYSVTDASDQPLDIEDRSLPISSLDSGLFFERQAGEHMIQTLEPRLFLLNVPYEDQSNIPIFDTGETEFSFSQLFRDNRFSGIDRIGDTRQLTLGLTSRLLDTRDGREHMSVSFGQIYYNGDRRVTLDNSTISTNQSDAVAELSLRLDNWSAKSTLQWDPSDRQMDRRNIQLHYAADDNRIVNLAYRFRRDPLNADDDLEQTDVSFSWPIGQRYALMGRWNYSLTDEDDIAKLLGFEYDSCCWTVRLVAQEYLTDNAVEPYDTSIMLQLIFKGLGSVHGKKAGRALENAILGYESDY